MISVGFNYPPELGRNATIKQALQNVAQFVRDLWLARSPYASGEYAKGLQRTTSVQVTGGQIKITNFCKYAAVIERGFSSYNLGMRILSNGKNVKVGADGNRYKVIKVTPKAGANYRKESVGQKVIDSFTKSMPIGMPVTKLTKYGGIKPYKQRISLRRPLKGKKPGKSAMNGFFVISEKAIKADPNKWRMPDRAGTKLAEKVQLEARPYVVAALRNAVKQERERQMRRRGLAPKWKPDLRSAFSMIPPKKG